VSTAAVVSPKAIDALYERLNKDAEASGYHLNPDREFTGGLVEGLLINEERYGYRACPCRLAVGDKRQDLDIICPCDYRDPDLVDWGACYCALYVSDEVLAGKQEVRPVPERRPPEGQRAPAPGSEPALPVWRCRVCGYLCAREQPPGVCPICKAKQDRFERFW
jgi:ferredoxin-thioredoxin reductase catalytic chain